MSVKIDNGGVLGSIIGFMALIVIIYRIAYIGLPIFQDGYNKGDIGMMLKALTQVV